MRLLESTLYKADLLRAVENSDLTKLDGKKIFVTGGLGIIKSIRYTLEQEVKKNSSLDLMDVIRLSTFTMMH